MVNPAAQVGCITVNKSKHDSPNMVQTVQKVQNVCQKVRQKILIINQIQTNSKNIFKKWDVQHWGFGSLF
jgi:hypothetical protein